MTSLMMSIYQKVKNIGEKAFWVENTRSWVVLDPDLAKDTLTSRLFAVPDPAIRIEKIASDHGFDISNLLDALNDAPLGKNGVQHKTTRKQFAEHLSPRLNAAVQAFSKTLETRLDHALRNDADINLFAEILVPAMNSAIEEIGGNPIDFNAYKIASMAQLFGSMQLLSASRLKKLNTELETTIIDKAETSKKRVMTLFSGDPTLGSLGLTLLQHLEANPGRRLCDINWSPEFTRTSTPFAERIATEDIVLADKFIKRNDRLFLYLGAAEEDPALYFGAGAHRCLGEVLARALWRSFVSALKHREESFEIVDVDFRVADFTFIMPIIICVRVAK